MNALLDGLEREAPELRLLLACAKSPTADDDEAAIRRLVERGTDWTAFARAALQHGLAALAGSTLLRVAADAVPDEILDAFRAVTDAAREQNGLMFAELASAVEALANAGVEAIAFKGPVFAMEAYGDLACRAPEEPKILVRAAALTSASAALEGLGYDRSRQRRMVRLAPDAMARCAIRMEVNGRTVPAPAPEDHLVLAVDEATLRTVCDVAAFVASHPGLEWSVVVASARAQRSLRMLLTAAALARRIFGSAVPDAVLAAGDGSGIEVLIARTLSAWRRGAPAADGESGSRMSAGYYRNLEAVSRRALEADRNNWRAWRSLGHAAFGLKRYEEAIACFDRALAFDPDDVIVWQKRRAAHRALGTGSEGQVQPTADPQDAEQWNVRAGAFWFAGAFAEADDACDRALELDPGNLAALRLGIHCRLHACDWRRREDDTHRVKALLEAGMRVIKPVDHRALCDSEAELRLSARLMAAHFTPSATPLWRGERYDHGKIRIAYLSKDFRPHPVATHIVGCIEEHDRSRFDVTGISLIPEDKSELGRRIGAAFDRFIGAHRLQDAAVAETLRALEIDIAVDLTGYTGVNRARILAYRPAPVQVNYLGYSGTMDLPFIDYILADPVVIPGENAVHYREKVAYLPHAALPNDRRRRIAEKAPSRSEAGLPETGFVFACLNNSYKIGPDVFEVWMRLLRAAEGSVLWLQSTREAAMANFRREAEARGVAPERLIPAARVERPEDHLARLRAADLFLDTLPYNAHATACDALWAGLPVVTCIGKTFPGRVGASLLRAVGLPELVTQSLEEYEEVALSLALDPSRLAALRAKLLRNRDTEPLFDTVRFTRNLEAAYCTMWQRQQAGLPPETFWVGDAP